ncbi:hypothetical protein [Microcoleus sp. S28C3]|uniref:hypothetical protein n=1 Tax=Microcoleus sp. S28C3 TaxID=3055414 RepID=UPI002FD34D4C
MGNRAGLPLLPAMKAGMLDEALTKETGFLCKIFGLDAIYLGRNRISDTAW